MNELLCSASSLGVSSVLLTSYVVNGATQEATDLAIIALSTAALLPTTSVMVSSSGLLDSGRGRVMVTGLREQILRGLVELVLYGQRLHLLVVMLWRGLQHFARFA